VWHFHFLSYEVSKLKKYILKALVPEFREMKHFAPAKTKIKEKRGF